MKRQWSQHTNKNCTLAKWQKVWRNTLIEKSPSVRNCSPTHWVTAPLWSCILLLLQSLRHTSHYHHSLLPPFCPPVIFSFFVFTLITLFFIFVPTLWFFFPLKYVRIKQDLKSDFGFNSSLTLNCFLFDSSLLPLLYFIISRFNVFIHIRKCN